MYYIFSVNKCVGEYTHANGNKYCMSSYKTPLPIATRNKTWNEQHRMQVSCLHKLKQTLKTTNESTTYFEVVVANYVLINYNNLCFNLLNLIVTPYPNKLLSV